MRYEVPVAVSVCGGITLSLGLDQDLVMRRVSGVTRDTLQRGWPRTFRKRIVQKSAGRLREFFKVYSVPIEFHNA